MTSSLITWGVLRSCVVHFPDNLLLETGESQIRCWETFGLQSTFTWDNEENDTSVTSGTSDRVREWRTVANLRRDLNHEIMNDTDFNLLLIVLLYLTQQKEYLSDWWIAQIGKNSEYFLKSSPLARYERRTNILISAADNVKSCDWPRDAVT